MCSTEVCAKVPDSASGSPNPKEHSENVCGEDSWRHQHLWQDYLIVTPLFATLIVAPYSKTRIFTFFFILYKFRFILRINKNTF